MGSQNWRGLEERSANTTAENLSAQGEVFDIGVDQFIQRHVSVGGTKHVGRLAAIHPVVVFSQIMMVLVLNNKDFAHNVPN